MDIPGVVYKPEIQALSNTNFNEPANLIYPQDSMDSDKTGAFVELNTVSKVSNGPLD